MATSRSYGDACGIARALDVVGERWALLVVRELLLGPQRFSDLHKALPNASSNLLADRLRELQDRGVIRRRRLAPPAGSWVYELTDRGRELEPALLALGSWGVAAPRPAGPTSLSPTSVLLYLRANARVSPEAPRIACRIEFDGRAWTVRTKARTLELRPAGDPGAEQVSVRTDPATLSSLLDDPASLDSEIASGAVSVDGDLTALRALLDLSTPGHEPALT